VRDLTGTLDAPVVGRDASFARRWWTYQSERFPLFAHGILIAAFSFCAVSLSRMLRGADGLPPWQVLLVAFVTCFTFFLQLRIADEFKDLEEDIRYRPYRPVPRGLVTLRELGWLFVIASLAQLMLALWLDERLVILLGTTWLYLALMSKEFFVGSWLRRRPVLYMTSHMMIMPLVDLYATSADWLPPAGWPPAGLLPFLLASYFNGLVIEIGRKVRSPADEEHGVDTYSQIWGRSTAVAAWLGTMALTFLFAMVVARRLNAVWAVGALLGAALLGGITIGALFLRKSAPGQGKWIERFSGVWTLALYLGLGLLPRLIRQG
jgi:4-hydroxybenzoate polyprenyltransferase